MPVVFSLFATCSPQFNSVAMPPYLRQPPSWSRKFAVALRGILLAVRTQNSFWVHLPVAVAVLIGAALHGVTRVEWAILILCIAVVLAAEMFNSALEHLARAITKDEHEDVRHALDVASGAVLITAIGAAIVGSLILLTRLFAALSR
jgi:diacylglycerol kinase